MAGKLNGKVAIITGSSSGIGEATAIAARRGKRLEDIAKRIEASGGKALPIVTDVTDETQANNLVQKTSAHVVGFPATRRLA